MAGAAKYVTAKVGRNVTMFVCQIFCSNGSSLDIAVFQKIGDSTLL